MAQGTGAEMGRERLTNSASGSTPNRVAAHNTSIYIPSVHSNVVSQLLSPMFHSAVMMFGGSTAVSTQQNLPTTFHNDGIAFPTPPTRARSTDNTGGAPSVQELIT